MNQKQWKEVVTHLNLGSSMVADKDAAFVLVATAEVEGEPHPKAAWVTSGIDQGSAARSEATIAMLEFAVLELKKNYCKRFGTEPTPRGYQPKN